MYYQYLKKIQFALSLQEGRAIIPNLREEDIRDIRKACKKNDSYFANLYYRIGVFNNAKFLAENPSYVPKGRDKKFYKQLLLETQAKIDTLRGKLEVDNEDYYSDGRLDEEIERKMKIKVLLKVKDNPKNELDFQQKIERAKNYPIENLIHFNSMGFAKCIAHQEKTPSLKKYENRAYCFSCHKNFDSIDIYMLINNVSWTEAVEQLKT